jgi:hypothetical protein
MEVCEGERWVERFAAAGFETMSMSEKWDEFDYFE